MILTYNKTDNLILFILSKCEKAGIYTSLLIGKGSSMKIQLANYDDHPRV